MARLPNSRPSRFINNDDEFDDIPIGRQRIVDGDVVEYENEDGDTFVFKKHEINDVIRECIDKSISEKNIDLYSEVEKKLTNYVTQYVNEMEKDVLERFYNKIDEVAERIAVETLNYRIEEEVQKRVEDKINKMK
jgi:gas vesicle protein